MSEENHPSKAQLFFMDHGEKVALGVAGGLVVLYLVLFLGSAGGNPDVEAVKKSAQMIQDESLVPHEDDVRRAPAFSRSSEKFNEFLENWATPATETSFPAGDWSTTLLTRGDFQVEPYFAEVKKPWELASVQFKNFQATARGITLAWSTTAPDDPEEKNVAEIDHFIVERKNPDGSKKELGKAKSDELTWLDEGVRKKTKYEYRVTPVTKDPGFIADRFNGKGRNSGWKMVTSIDIWKITFSNPDPSEKRVYVMIEKEDKKYGKLTTKAFQEAGQKIGWWKEKKVIEKKDEFGRVTTETIDEVTADHLFRVRGMKEKVEVSFDTGRTITAIETRNYSITRKECNEETGTCRLVDRVMLEKYEVKVVVFTDEDGKEHVWMNKDPADHRRAKPKYTCDQHKSAAPK